jgi:hypothetical protein
MAITFARLQELLDGEGLKYFIDPKSSRVMLRIGSPLGAFDVGIALLDDGRFLQFRTINLRTCSVQSPHVPAMLRLLAVINYEYRFVKYGWDTNDGEIAVYGDLWIQDSSVTQEQFHTITGNFFTTVQRNLSRLTKVIETGKDPGETSIEQMLEEAFSGRDLPPELKELVEAMKKGGKPPSGPGDDSTV